MSQTQQGATTLVVGGTGKTGRRVMERLSERGVDTRNASRRSQPPFSWEDSSTWGPLLEGVDRVYAVFPGWGTEEDQEQIGRFIELADRGGVQRFVMLSAWGPESPVERALRASAMQWTTVSPGWFNQNFSDDFEQKFREDIRAGVMATSYGETTFAFIDVDDIADAVVAALLEEGHHGQSYPLTGPRAMTFAQACQEISRALGRPITYTELTVEQYTHKMVQTGMPAELAAAMADMTGMDEQPADGVRRALGREPKDFAQYAREMAATGVWDA